jgi:quercetin dioxygenase-like cupin family protein
VPFYKFSELPDTPVNPGHASAHGATITGNELEIGWYTEPKGSGAKPHHHPSEQMMVVLSGRMRIRIGDETREVGPGEVALIYGDEEHEQTALEENTRFLSFKRSTGQLPPGE